MKIKFIFLLCYFLFTINIQAKVDLPKEKLFEKYFTVQEINEIKELIEKFDLLKKKRKLIKKFTFEDRINKAVEYKKILKEYQKLEDKYVSLLKIIEKKISKFKVKNTNNMQEYINNDFKPFMKNKKKTNILIQKKIEEFEIKSKNNHKIDKELETLRNILFNLTRTKIGGKIIKGEWKDDKLVFNFDRKEETEENLKRDKKIIEKNKNFINLFYVKMYFINFIILISIFFIVTFFVFLIKRKKYVKKYFNKGFLKILFISLFFLIINYFVSFKMKKYFSLNSINLINGFLLKIEPIIILIISIIHYFKKTEN
jgi:hypothetical protein